MQDAKSFLVNYNHYYTDTISQRRQERQKNALAAECLKSNTSHTALTGCHSSKHSSATVDVGRFIKSFSQRIDPDMDSFSCEDALDFLLAIYKVRTSVSHKHFA